MSIFVQILSYNVPVLNLVIQCWAVSPLWSVFQSTPSSTFSNLPITTPTPLSSSPSSVVGVEKLTGAEIEWACCGRGDCLAAVEGDGLWARKWTHSISRPTHTRATFEFSMAKHSHSLNKKVKKNPFLQGFIRDYQLLVLQEDMFECFSTIFYVHFRNSGEGKSTLSVLPSL